jgi:hypothetical protein
MLTEAMQSDSLSYFLNRMKDIRAGYLDVIQSGSVAMLHAVVDSQRPQDVPLITDRDVQLMQWVVRTGIIHDSPLGTKSFLTFLIQLKGASEAKILKQAQAHDAELSQLMESVWLRKFEEHGSTAAAKAQVVPLVQSLSKSERFKKIINTSYQTAKQKWEP